jgi:uncharacterized phiE125 gp8 family phage protein
MWYPAAVTAAPAGEPVTRAEVKAQASIDFTDDDTLIDLLIAAARAHVEKYTGVRLVTQTLTFKCDGFSDMARLPEGPLQSVTSISYVDTDGVTQTLATSIYEVRADGLETAVVLKFGQSWPAIQPGSRITVVAVAGFASVPDDIKRALLLYIVGGYATRENDEAYDWSAFDCLLVNHRRNA